MHFVLKIILKRWSMVQALVLVAIAERGFSRGQTRRFGNSQKQAVFKETNLEIEKIWKGGRVV